MARNSTHDFDLADTEESQVSVSGTDRHDIYVDGAVNIVISVNGVEKTIGTVTDTMNNFFCTTGFKLVATGGAAAGSVVSISTQR